MPSPAAWAPEGRPTEACGPLLWFDGGKPRSQSQDAGVKRLAFPDQWPQKPGPQALGPLPSARSHLQHSSHLASTTSLHSSIGSHCTTGSSFMTAGSQFRLPAMKASTPRTAPGSPLTADLAFSLRPTPRRGGAAVWKLLAEEPPEAPWEQRKDEAMWAALTGLRSNLERQRRRLLVLERRAERAKAQAKAVKPVPKAAAEEAEPAEDEDRAAAWQMLERTFRRRQARQLLLLELKSARKSIEEQTAELEELRADEESMAAVAIQAVIRGFQQRSRRSVEEVQVAERVQETVRQACDAPKPWKPGAELPSTTVDGLWELLKGGHISGQIYVQDLLAHFADCKRTGLNIALSNAVLGNFSGIQSPKDPKEVYPRQVAYMVSILLQSPRMEITRDEVRKRVLETPDPMGTETPGYQDLGITSTTRMSLIVFRKTFKCVALLMAVDECYIISHIVWHITGDFEITKEMGVHIYRQVGVKPPNPMRLGYQEFLQLCVAFRVQLTSGRNVFQGDSVLAIFHRALPLIPKAFERRRARLMHERTNDDFIDKHEKKRHVNGWTELSILLQELFAAIPDGAIPNPLQMCLAGPQFTHEMQLS